MGRSWLCQSKTAVNRSCSRPPNCGCRPQRTEPGKSRAPPPNGHAASNPWEAESWGPCSVSWCAPKFTRHAMLGITITRITSTRFRFLEPSGDSLGQRTPSTVDGGLCWADGSEDGETTSSCMARLVPPCNGPFLSELLLGPTNNGPSASTGRPLNSGIIDRNKPSGTVPETTN